MKFGVAMELDWKAEESSHTLQNFVDALAIRISKRNYGSAIENFTVGLICIKTEVGYEEWNKERKPRFRSLEKVKLLTGQELELKNTYTYDIKLNNEEVDAFISCNNKAVRIFCDRLIKSFIHFKSSSMKKRDFKADEFGMDVEKFIDEISNA